MSDVLVLCYHAVSPSWPAALSVTPEAFERHMSFLARRDWKATTFHEAATNPPARRTLAITFDDAYLSVYERARPILQSFGWTATVFAPSSFLSVNQPLLWPGIERWADTPYATELTGMNWAQLGALVEEGWEVGSHTCTHPRLTTLSDELVRLELGQSRHELSEALGHACQTVAYPYGDVDERVAELARQAGYAAGAALAFGLKDAGAMRRARVGVYHADHQRRFVLKALGPSRRLRARFP